MYTSTLGMTVAAAIMIGVALADPPAESLKQCGVSHCGLADEPPRAPPQAPPPPTRELQYVSDLEFVHDPGPAEPTWSADGSTPLISQTPP